MAIKTSGPLGMNEIAAEFGGSAPHSLSEYYAGGGLVPAGTSGINGAIPSSGLIRFSHFYGAAAAVFGETWTLRLDNNDLNFALYSVSGIASAYQSSGFHAVGKSGIIFYSSSGTGWSQIASAGVLTPYDLNDVNGEMPLPIAVGNSGTILRNAGYIGPTYWEAVPEPPGTATNYKCVAYGNGRYVILGDTASNIAYSSNTDTWSELQGAPNISGGARDIKFQTGLFLAATSNGIYISDNGLSGWSNVLPANTFFVTYGFGYHLVLAQTARSNSTTLFYSNNPASASWQSVVLPGNILYRSMAFSSSANKLIVFPESGSTAYMTSDLANFSPVYAGSNEIITSAAPSNSGDYIAAVSIYGNIYTTP